MKCSYHPATAASARCHSCERPLCSACDHRIKGHPHCQDCIVAGIEALHRQTESGRRPSPGGMEKNPVLALLLAFVPGLGAAYNEQNIKALIHFTITVGLWTLSDIFGSPLETMFLLSCATFYFYSIYDAYNSAHRARQGENLAEEDNRLRASLRDRINLWGGALIGIGLLSILDFRRPDLLQRYWPALLILVGLVCLWLHHSFQRPPSSKPEYRTPPPSVIPSSFDRSTTDFSRADSRYDR